MPPAGQGTIESIVGFGEDAAGNLYIVDLTGEVFRVEGPTAVPSLSLVGRTLVALLVLWAGARTLGIGRLRRRAA